MSSIPQGEIEAVVRDVTLENLVLSVIQLRQALGYFLDDARFQVAVGGNPIMVDAMLKRAREAYDSTALDKVRRG